MDMVNVFDDDDDDDLHVFFSARKYYNMTESPRESKGIQATTHKVSIYA